MNIQILSDLHIEFEDFVIDYSNADLIVLAGDINIGDKGIKWALNSIKDIPIIYVLGNHEYYKHSYPRLPQKLKELTADTHIHLLENDSVTVDGVTFYGCTLWTDFELLVDPRIAGYECQLVMSDYRKIRKDPGYSRLRSIDTAMIHQASIEWLKNAYQTTANSTNIVITHHAPSALSIPKEFADKMISSGYASNLDDLVEALSPTAWIHGHLHNSSNYNIANTRVICNPRGYPDERNRNFNPTLLLKV